MPFPRSKGKGVSRGREKDRGKIGQNLAFFQILGKNVACGGQRNFGGEKNPPPPPLKIIKREGR